MPINFNHVCYRGVAARAWSVHLMYSNDRKIDRKGGGQDTHKTTSSSQTLTMSLSMKIWLTTGILLEVQRKINTVQPWQNRNAHSNISATPPHSPTPHSPTQCHNTLRWVEQHHLHSITDPLPRSSPTLPKIKHEFSTSFTDGLGLWWAKVSIRGVWQRSKVTSSRGRKCWKSSVVWKGL